MEKTTHKTRKAAILAEVTKCKERIAAERDKLRDLLDDLETICETADEAEQALETAIDALSQYL